MSDSIFLTIPLSEHSAANNCVFWISNRTFPFSKSASKVYSLEINQPLWTHASSESAKVWWAGLEWHRTPLPELWSSNIFATLGACVIWKYIKYIEMTGDSTSQAEDCFWTLSAWLTQPLSIDCVAVGIVRFFPYISFGDCLWTLSARPSLSCLLACEVTQGNGSSIQ